MRPAAVLLLAALAWAPSPARAQRADRTISLESSISLPLRRPGAAAALGASWWLDGDLHATARLGWGVVGRTGGRAVSGAVGLAWAPGVARVRPRTFGEVGWVRLAGPLRFEGRVALAAGVGLEWFVRRDVAVTAGAAIRHAYATSVELFGGVRAGY